MVKQSWFSALGLIGLLFLTLNACTKDEAEVVLSEEDTLDMATRTLKSQQLIGTSFGIATRGAAEVDGLVSNVPEVRSSCGTITVTPADLKTFPKTVVVDFGTGCTDVDGKNKSGKVTMIVGKIWEPNSLVTLQYENYSEDGVKLDGKFSFSNNSSNTAGIYQIKADKVKITDAKNETWTWSGTHNFTQTQGHASWWNWNDDVYDVTGNIDVLFPNNEVVTWNINTPLLKANNCYWVSKGLGVLKLNGTDIQVDYGDGSCDNNAIVTLNGKTFTVKL
ncbi:MAG TPA: hypothetical protein PLE32_04115 [Haliscomenobacter sp.]|nr:hypothetical protein [Haliscomenobacter sp.]